MIHPKDVAFVNNIAIATAAAYTGGAAGALAGNLIGGVVAGAAVGAITGGVVGGVLSAAQGGTFSDGFASGMMTGLVSGAIAGGIAGYNSAPIPTGVTGGESYAIHPAVVCGFILVGVALIFKDQIIEYYREKFPEDRDLFKNQGGEAIEINSTQPQTQPQQGNQCVA